MSITYYATPYKSCSSFQELLTNPYNERIASKNSHYKARQDPFWKAMDTWNKLPINIRNADSKEQLKKLMGAAIENPYKK